jgi:hypothetical protein
MKRIACIVAFALALGFVASRDALAAGKRVTLKEEERTTLRVGDFAVLRIPTDRRLPEGSHHLLRYLVQSPKTSPMGTLVVVRRSKNTVLYRAVRPGGDSIVLSPVTKPGECISCATLHYFIIVVPK